MGELSSYLSSPTVYKRKCTAFDCDGELTHDGQEQCLLTSSQHLFTSEVLQCFLFHFLLGRLILVHSIGYCLFIILQLILGQQYSQNILYLQEYMKMLVILHFQKQSATIIFVPHGIHSFLELTG